MAKRNIFAVGGSAGSTEPLKTLLAGLPGDFPGALLITTHVASTHESYLPEMLGRAGRIPVRSVSDGQPIEEGHAYVARADRHLLLIDSTICLGYGPRENMCRPAVDPMFRSAALAYGPRAVGVVLSGMLNDGASGLFAIKQAGGTAVVQHPLDAHASEMPRAALAAVEADYVAPAADLPGLLVDIAKLDAAAARPAPDSLKLEVELAAGRRVGSDGLRRFADPAPITCPDCGGVLSEVRDQLPLRFRCQIGHAYTATELAGRNEAVDEAIRVALRVVEERVTLVERLARDARAAGRGGAAALYEQRAEEYRRYATTLRDAAILSLRIGEEAREEPI